MGEAVCPVCASPGEIVKRLSGAEIARCLTEFMEREFPGGLGSADYWLRRCGKCTLEFADPLLPADGRFYEWLDHGHRYYVAARWEWDRVAAIVEEQHRAKPVHAVLEFGGGRGEFLQRIRTQTGGRVVNVERTPEFVAELSRQGQEAYTTEAASECLRGQAFDFVLAFHYLEHVADPVAFVRGLCANAGEAGRVFVSLPYSPMFFETHWYDPLNHPPHHLTRWNARSIHALAEAVDRTCTLSMPPAPPLLTRARYALALRHLGPHWGRRRRRVALLPALHPVDFCLELVAQARRDRVHGHVAADVMLVEFARRRG